MKQHHPIEKYSIICKIFCVCPLTLWILFLVRCFIKFFHFCFLFGDGNAIQQGFYHHPNLLIIQDCPTFKFNHLPNSLLSHFMRIEASRHVHIVCTYVCIRVVFMCAWGIFITPIFINYLPLLLSFDYCLQKEGTS